MVIKYLSTSILLTSALLCSQISYGGIGSALAGIASEIPGAAARSADELATIASRLVRELPDADLGSWATRAADDLTPIDRITALNMELISKQSADFALIKKVNMAMHEAYATNSPFKSVEGVDEYTSKELPNQIQSYITVNRRSLDSDTIAKLDAFKNQARQADEIGTSAISSEDDILSILTAQCRRD